MQGEGLATGPIKRSRQPQPAAGRGLRQRLARLTHGAGLLPLVLRLRALRRDDLRILAYHRVLSVPDESRFGFDLDLVSASAEQFDEQLRMIRRRFQPLSFAEVLDHFDRRRRLPPRAILLSFDDGYDDNYRVAFPLLRAQGLSAMFFVSTDHIEHGRPYAYDWLVHMVCVTQADTLQAPELGVDTTVPRDLHARRRLAADLLDRMKWLDDAIQHEVIVRLEREWNLPRAQGHADCRPMSWEQLREMHAGGMEIGSHGVGHRMLAKLPQEEMVAEVHGSKATLERELGAPVTVLSYPVGGINAYDDRVIDAARAAGYRLACTYVAGTNPQPIASPYTLRRLPVERGMDAAWFAAMTTLPEVFSYPSRLRMD